MHALHHVESATGLNATSPRYVGPLLGNGELGLFLDENGVMHDFAPLAGRGAPRIYWAGRRHSDHGRTLAPFGFFAAAASWEWMESTRWSQALDPRTGVVTTVHERGTAQEVTHTLLLLDRNLIAVHKAVRDLRGGGQFELGFRLCPPRDTRLPTGMALTASGRDDSGAWLAYRLDGTVVYHGRIAVWTDRPCEAAAADNELRVRVPVQTAADELTVYLALVDDLGDDMLYRATGWGGRHKDHPMLAPVLKALHDQPVHRGDPEDALRELRAWTESVGWTGVLARQKELWDAFFASGWVELSDAPDVQAVWETGMYAARSQLTRWSIPVAIHGNYFNGQYFHDEYSGAKALLQAGHWPLVERMADFRLSQMPLGMQMVDGAGARCDAAAFEGGHFNVAPMGCSVYEVHANGEPARLVWNWLAYAGFDRARLERYYPLLWAIAEFFRRWMVYRGPDGRYFTGACVDFNEFVPAVRNGVATVAAAAGSLRVAAQAAERLGRDPELAAQWREIADGLQRNAPVNRRGALAEYEGDDGVSMTSLRIVATSLSNGLIPARDPVVGRTLKLLYGECKTAENWTVSAPQDPELHRRVAGPRSPDASAWTWPAAEMVGVAAAAGDGEMAAAVVRELIRCSGNFGSLYECKVMRDGFVSLPWFVTSDAELSASISMMLLQCEGDRIELLPGVPQAWKNLRFRLAAPNRTAVEAEVEGGVLKALRITGPMGTRTLRVPRRFKAERLLGAPSAETSEHHEFAVRVAPLGSPPDRGP